MARVNKREVQFKQEVTAGTAEALAVGDILVRSRDADDITIDIETFETEEVQGTSSKRPVLKGRRVFDAALSYILRGPNSQLTVPAVDPLFESSMFLGLSVKKISIGAITGGPYKHGETVTGGTSAATGTVWMDTATGAALLLLTGVSGTFISAEVLTGGTSAATSTSSSGTSDNGFGWHLTDSDFGSGDSKHHATCEWNQDGFMWRGRGCLSNLRIGFSVGNPCVVSQRILGALTTHGDDVLLLPSTYPEESNTVPRFLDAQLTIGGYTPKAIVDMELVVETNPEPDLDANDTAADGVLYANYERDAPQLTLEPKMVPASEKDFFTELQDGTSFQLDWQVGSVAGMIWKFRAPSAQFEEVGAGRRRTMATAPMTCRLNGTNNDELFIHQE